MSKLRKCFVWFYMLSKRLLFKWSFVVLLSLIPIIIPLTNVAMSQESGILRIVVFGEGEDNLAKKVINSLINNDSVILFWEASSAEEAKKAVNEHKADAAWIFSENYSDLLDKYVAYGASKPFVEIIQREETIPLRIAKEKLFGAIYSDFSYSIYKNFVYSEIVGDDVSPLVVREYYDRLTRGNDIVKLEKLNTKESEILEVNYLNAPIRGILSLIVILCTLAAAMYFLKDQIEGKFDWLSHKKRLAPAFASCLSASAISSVAIFVALRFSGMWTGFLNEIIPIILYIISAAGFCLVFCQVISSPGKLGALIPGIIIIMLVLSPIFFNLKELRPFRLMMPTYYYLQSVYNEKYYVYSIIYCVIVYLLAFLLNNIKLRKSKSII